MDMQQRPIHLGLRIEAWSLGWMVIEAGVALSAGLAAHALALTGFGVDSIIELVSGGILFWRLTVETQGASSTRIAEAERRAAWVVGLALLALAVYLAAMAALALWTHGGARPTRVGLALAAASGCIMPYLAQAKRRIGARIPSPALAADGACSIVCAYMAWTVVAGLALTAWLGWWWLNPLAALALLYFIVKEGIEAVQEARGIEDSCCRSNFEEHRP